MKKKALTRRVVWGFMGAVMASLLAPPIASADSVDLSTWTAESYPAVSGFGAGVWTVSAGGDTVTQSVNGQPTLFFSDFDAMGTDVRGTIRVTGSDDDFMGFVLGFDPGDTSSSGADYLLIDWKGANQDFDFGNPSTTPGGLAPAGLAVSRVTGVPTADEFWQHTNYASHTGGGLTELARGTNLGATGWARNTDYVFRFVFHGSQLQVYVDDVLELDIAGSFSNGRIGFYNFSQAGVVYSAFTVEDAPPIPEPATLSLLGVGMAAIAVRRRRC